MNTWTGSYLCDSRPPSGLERSERTKTPVSRFFYRCGLEVVNAALKSATQHSFPLPLFLHGEDHSINTFPFCSPFKKKKDNKINHQVVIVSLVHLPFQLSFTPLLLCSAIHGCATRLNSPLCFLFSLFLAIFPSKAIVLWSCIYIFNSNDYISLFFFQYSYICYIFE